MARGANPVSGALGGGSRCSWGGLGTDGAFLVLMLTCNWHLEFPVNSKGGFLPGSAPRQRPVCARRSPARADSGHAAPAPPAPGELSSPVCTHTWRLGLRSQSSTQPGINGSGLLARRLWARGQEAMRAVCHCRLQRLWEYK